MANPKNLPADLLAYMQSLQAPTQYGQNGAQYTRDGLMPVFNQSWAASPETGQGPSGDGALMSIVGPGRNPEENAEFDPQTGEFRKYYTVKDKFMGMDPALAFALATGGMMMLPGGPLNGLFGSGAAAGDGATLAGSDGASTLAGGAGSDTAGAGVFNAAKDSQLANLAWEAQHGVGSAAGGYAAAGATPAAVNLGAGTGNALGMNTLSSGSWLSDLLPGGLGETLGKLAPNLVGAALGAAGSKDQTQTSSREPWGPAQPWMKDNISKGQDLQKFYENNPFNDVQKGALQGLLDVSNTGTQALPSLLDFANRMGQSNYQRSGGRNLAYSAPSTATPRGVMPTGLSAAAPIDWASMNPFARKA